MIKDDEIMEVQLRSADLKDLDLLTEMNKQLIEDEVSLNPMDLSELKQRMLGWLQEESLHVDVIMRNKEVVVGYALYCFKENQYFKEIKEVYLRQYFIKREYRQQRFGLKAIEVLKETRFTGIDTIEIDVLESNVVGKNFWIRAGFKPYVINMRMKI